MHSVVWTYALESLALVVAVWAGWIDWHSRRIPNWLTVPALMTGIVVSTLGGGWAGTKASLEGAGLGLGLLLPFVLLRGLGAGDWKLMGAIGAFLGWAGLVVVLLGTVFIAGLMAVVQIIRNRRIKETLRNLWVLLLAMFTFGIPRPAGEHYVGQSGTNDVALWCGDGDGHHHAGGDAVGS